MYATKNFKPKDEKEGERESSHTRKCVSETRESTINLDRHVYRKSEDKENKLSYMGHAIMENRNDLAIEGFFEEASDMTELVASEGMLEKKASQF